MNDEFVQPEVLDVVERKRRRDRRIAHSVTIVVHVLLLLVFAAVTILPELFQEPEIRVTMVAPTTQTVPSLSRQEVARMAPQTPNPSSVREAVEFLKSMSPETIVLLSDGEPSGEQAPEVHKITAELQKKRREPTTISTISYLSTGGRKFMEELASAN